MLGQDRFISTQRGICGGTPSAALEILSKPEIISLGEPVMEMITGLTETSRGGGGRWESQPR